MSVDESKITQAPLCTQCKSLFNTTPEQFYNIRSTTGLVDGKTPHHTTIASLQHAVDLGCYICLYLNDSWQNIERSLDFLWTIRVEFNGTHLERVTRRGQNDWDFQMTFTVDYLQYRTVMSKPMIGSESITFCALTDERVAAMLMSTTLGAATGSAHSMRQAKNWINQCCASHSRCVRHQPPSRLPTRLLYVTDHQGSGLHVQLCDGQSLPSDTPYLTLSHRWGETKSITTTKENIALFYAVIPFENLRRVFQDALSITMALGFSYLWIDSLCIIQGDKEDWSKESRLMHDVYRNAVCNLSASGFLSADEGLLVAERWRNPIPPGVRLNPPLVSLGADHEQSVVVKQVSPQQDIQSNTIDSVRSSDIPEARRDGANSSSPDVPLSSGLAFILTEPDPFTNIVSGPLFHRAWVLQEQILVRSDPVRGTDAC
jgi:hypothetical protein